MNLTRKTALITILGLLPVSCSTSRQTAKSLSTAMHVDSTICHNIQYQTEASLIDSAELQILELTIPRDSCSPLLIKVTHAKHIKHTRKTSNDSTTTFEHHSCDSTIDSTSTDACRSSSGIKTFSYQLPITLLLLIITLFTIKRFFKS